MAAVLSAHYCKQINNSLQGLCLRPVHTKMNFNLNERQLMHLFKLTFFRGVLISFPLHCE